MDNKDDMKSNGEKTQKGYSILQIILGAVMLGIGMQYLRTPAPVGDGSQAAPISEGKVEPVEVEPCPNGAAHYLYVAGIIILVTNLVAFLSHAYRHFAERDGKISCGEGCILGLLKFSSAVLAIADIVVLIWGSVVVFGAWSTWTDDYDAYVANPDETNFCKNQPMMTAFIILIIKWVMIPVLMLLVCFCTCLCGCCCAACASKANTGTA